MAGNGDITHGAALNFIDEYYRARSGQHHVLTTNDTNDHMNAAAASKMQQYGGAVSNDFSTNHQQHHRSPHEYYANLYAPHLGLNPLNHPPAAGIYNAYTAAAAGVQSYYHQNDPRFYENYYYPPAATSSENNVQTRVDERQSVSHHASYDLSVRSEPSNTNVAESLKVEDEHRGYQDELTAIKNRTMDPAGSASSMNPEYMSRSVNEDSNKMHPYPLDIKEEAANVNDESVNLNDHSMNTSNGLTSNYHDATKRESANPIKSESANTTANEESAAKVEDDESTADSDYDQSMFECEPQIEEGKR